MQAVTRKSDKSDTVEDQKASIIPKVTVSVLPIGSSMDMHALRKDMSPLEDSFRKRKIDESLLRDFVKTDKEWRESIVKLNESRSQKNKLSIAINAKRGDSELLEQARALDKSMIDLEKCTKELDEKRELLLLALPNIIDPLQPLDVVKPIIVVGRPRVEASRVADFEEQYPGVEFTQVRTAKTQYDIIKEYGLVNEERGAEFSGARFYYKLNELSLLDLALSLHSMKILQQSGFNPITPPYLVKREVEAKATTLDAFEEMLYKVEGEDLYLIPTAEHPIAAFNSGKVIPEAELPLRYCGFSTAFRKEAGAHGKDTKGIYRNHHFNKVEQYIIAAPNQIEDELNRVINNQAALLLSLNIPVRAIYLPTWDMDKKAILHVDVEGWFPGQNRFGELGSHATVGSWQASRMNVKYLPKGQQTPALVHTLYGTMVPVERTLACMLENNLGEDGIIHIPKVLADMIGIDEIKPRK
ncbi:MAG: serine--tRNA ligase [Candidatus Marsarchaeota archaeon]|jgi:seryl-tRNA synthetase|nr:serine--tRNA ligase [Candidatus Marsarchaeota archaeon]